MSSTTIATSSRISYLIPNRSRPCSCSSSTSSYRLCPVHSSRKVRTSPRRHLSRRHFSAASQATSWSNFLHSFGMGDHLRVKRLSVLLSGFRLGEPCLTIRRISGSSLLCPSQARLSATCRTRSPLAQRLRLSAALRLWSRRPVLGLADFHFADVVTY